MSILSTRRTAVALAAGAALVTFGATGAVAASAPSTGPSSSDAPYLVPAAPGVTLTSILTAGDSVGGYAMAGTPDGMGAFDNGDGTFTVLMNHEFTATDGAVRAHGAKGAFVSKWVIRKKDLSVVSGSDQIRKVFVAGPTGYVETAGVAFSRFCSADLAAPSAYYDRRSRVGYPGRIFTNGEETSGGRAFAHVVATGETYQLADLGSASWENVVANPATGRKTVVAGTSDAGGGRVYLYVGDKKATGNPVEKAGLTGGTRYAVSVDGLPVEDGAQPAPDGGRFTLVPDTTGTNGTGWDRPEDGSWDPAHPNDFYFTTTASMTKSSRLWRLRFDDVRDPAKGGTLTKIIEGPADLSGGPKMMDNLTVANGKILVQEDPGNNAYLAGVYQYDLRSKTLTRILDHDPARFLTGGTQFETIDEESSGVIPVPFLGRGAYLIADQNHTKVTDAAQVEKGQLLLVRLPFATPYGERDDKD